jgi:hypothetical protein
MLGCDALTVAVTSAVGALLIQILDMESQAIRYLSQALNKMQQKCSQTEREVLAIP